ncbi:hypothetical protein [Cetobacterium sp.]|uniref:hypothetical protein n=1 Tax=Cetobacterium sp. TaxID=2071632 RepID=UPI003F31D66C
MGICKRCGSNFIVKTVKTEIQELFYPGSDFPDKSKRLVITKYKYKDCGATKTKSERY